MNSIQTSEELVTPYSETRAGFISVALEKNRQANPFVTQAKALRSFAMTAKRPDELLGISEIRAPLLAASGISDKAKNHLEDSDQLDAIRGLIENFLEPAGDDFVDELVYRFLLTKGDALGGIMRNLAGKIGEWKFIEALISTLEVSRKDYWGLLDDRKTWMPSKLIQFNEIGKHIKGLSWTVKGSPRTLIFNLTVPLIRKNVDLCLFDCNHLDVKLNVPNPNSAHRIPDKYLALGELKGGIDPAGADEHWKTAKSALIRIRDGFARESMSPNTFFIGAAIARAMSVEIYAQLKDGTLSNAANLTHDDQLFSLCNWLTCL